MGITKYYTGSAWTEGNWKYYTGSAWADPVAKYYNGSSWISVDDQIVVSPRVDGASTTRENNNCFVGFQIASSGTEYEYNNVGSLVSATTWLDSGTAAEVWVMWTRTGGTLSDWNNLGGGNNNVRLQCSTTRSFRISRTTTGTDTIQGYTRWYDAATGGKLLFTTSTVTWSAERTFNACPTCCFTPDTLITMADGSKKPIGQIEVGDLIRTNPYNTEAVTGVITRTDRVMYKMTFADGSHLILSEDHPIMTSELGWACINSRWEYKNLGMVPELKVGMTAQTEAGLLVPIARIEKVDYTGTVYTLENAQFFANGWLVY